MERCIHSISVLIQLFFVVGYLGIFIRSHMFKSVKWVHHTKGLDSIKPVPVVKSPLKNKRSYDNTRLIEKHDRQCPYDNKITCMLPSFTHKHNNAFVI